MNEQQQPNTLILAGALLFALGLGYMVGYGNGRESRKRRRVFA